MRPYITKALALAILAGAFFLMRYTIDSNKPKRPVSAIQQPTAFIQKVQNQVVPVNIVESGRLSAKYKIDIFSEVQGVMQPSAKEFKPGAKYKKGQTLVRIKSDDYYANLQAQKSVFQNLITSILPDLKLDYPDAFTKWDKYLRDFDMNKSLAPLPEPGSDKEKFFLTGKNVYTTYYNTKNMEIVYRKYVMTAPFDGILTEALVTPGSLIRVGQKLGEFINPKQYELELSISKALIHSVKIGKEVIVYQPENPVITWKGKVSRINGKIDPATQTIQVYVALKDSELKEGMYLEATIAGQEKLNAIEISRSLIQDESKVYTLSPDSVLDLTDIIIVHKTEKTVIVQGLANGDNLVARPIPGAYAGMKVNAKIQE